MESDQESIPIFELKRKWKRAPQLFLLSLKTNKKRENNNQNYFFWNYRKLWKYTTKWAQLTLLFTWK